ncbi:MAG: MFS transporter [Blastocatellia bacterium]
MSSSPRPGDEPTVVASIPSTVAAEVAPRTGQYRWMICALLFFATTINYVDRQVIGILAKDLQAAIGWSEIDYGNIVAAFNGAYALGLLVSGRLIDKFGSKVGYALAIIVWSLAGMATSLARSAFGFGIARAALGLGEAANFPAAIKTVAEWFPKKERALTTGIFNAGTNVGAVIAPLTVPWIAIHWGWQWAFVLTGALGFLWLLFWLPNYRKPEAHPRLSQSELAYIRSDPPEPPAARLSWAQLIPHRQMAAFAIGKYLTDPVWWFYLFWIPNFLRQKHGLDLSTVGLPLIAIYLIADIGSIGGGWLSSALIKRGWTINRARKTAMLICAVAVLPIMLMPSVNNLWLAVGLFGLAAAAHQGWSANIYTTASDTFPRHAVGSVVGIGGMAGAMGGVTMAVATGYILDRTGGNYMLIFFAVGPAYLVALALMHLLVPRVRQMDEAELAAPKRLSVGGLVGFGFVGLVIGSFAGWCLGLLAQQPGHELLKNIKQGEALLIYMAAGALIGMVIGIIMGNIFSKIPGVETPG